MAVFGFGSCRKISINKAGFITMPLLAGLLVGCASTPEINPYLGKSLSRSPRPHSSRQSSHLSRSALVDYAMSLEGAPYRYGKSSPEEGFDCSGYVQHVYQQHGVMLPRRAQDMAVDLETVSKNQLLPGDLVFFNTNGSAFSHVGIFIDDDSFIHASSQRTGRVLVSHLNSRYWQKHFSGARRP
jgi:cell wall-associated NlpC family hydrolase